MAVDVSSYRKLLKGSAVFGGVQVFNILIGLIRGKLVALFLGPEGLGLISIFNSSICTVQQFSSLGLNLSGVKEISKVRESGDHNAIFITANIVRKLISVTAFIGLFAMIILSFFLSKSAFGSNNYTWHFIILSVFIFFTTLSNGELSILQGCQKIKDLARASVIGGICGLFIGVPLYYFWGNNGIVPAMIVLSLTTYIFNRRASLKTVQSSFNYPLKRHRSLIRSMIELGVVSMLSTILGSLANLLLVTFIGRTGTLEDVGLYQASNSITGYYANIVFSAMAADLFPRLAGISQDNKKVAQIVNYQSEINLLIIAPIVLFVIICSPLCIEILLSKDFIQLVPVVRWMAFGVFFRAVAFPMGYISFAKGDKKFFFWFDAFFGSISMLLLNVWFYHDNGLVGIGYSYTIVYIVSLLLYVVLLRRRYGFVHTVGFLKLFVIYLALLSIVICCTYCNGIFAKTLLYISFALCISFSMWGLNKRLGILKF